MTTIFSLAALSDDQLIARVQLCAKQERDATSNLVAALTELDARRLYLGAGCSSLFTYCTQVLHLSEYAAYARIEAARAARRFPLILELLSAGSITLTTVGLLAQHLTSQNYRDLLGAVRHKSKREVEQLVATLRPKADVPSTIRKVPAPSLVALPPATVTAPVQSEAPSAQLAARDVPQRRAIVTPLAPDRFKIQITVSRETHDMLRRVQDLLRHSVPDGDPAVIFDRALTLLLAELERKKMAATTHPRPAVVASRSRHLPASVRREVWRRDAGQCAFVGTEGRCQERGFLEYHHVVPYAEGGATTAENLQLRCRAHNVYEMEQYFGPLFVREKRFDMARTGSGPS
jgi:hypothetical protein